MPRKSLPLSVMQPALAVLPRLANAGLSPALAHSRVLVTGATGLVGRVTVQALLTLQGQHGKAAGGVVALVRDAANARALWHTPGTRDLPPHLRLVAHDLTRPLPPPTNAAAVGHVDYVIHCATPTQSCFFVEHPLETIDSIANGTRHVLEFALQAGAHVVHLSSMEVYGAIEGDAVPEDAPCHLDLASLRSSCSEAERFAECLCTAYAHTRNLPVSVARLARVVGTELLEDGPRVFIDFARRARAGKDICLRTAGNSAHCHCGVADAVVAIFLLLLRGEQGQAYNVGNREAFCSIRELADHFARLAEPSVQVVLEPEGAGIYPPPHRINLDTSRIERLGWTAETGLEEMILRLLTAP